MLIPLQKPRFCYNICPWCMCISKASSGVNSHSVFPFVSRQNTFSFPIRSKIKKPASTKFADNIFSLGDQYTSVATSLSSLMFPLLVLSPLLLFTFLYPVHTAWNKPLSADTLALSGAEGIPPKFSEIITRLLFYRIVIKIFKMYIYQCSI